VHSEFDTALYVALLGYVQLATELPQDTPFQEITLKHYLFNLFKKTWIYNCIWCA